MRSVSPRLEYVPALDGLRALAIGLVMLFHAGVPGVPGANLGVDVFFVLSGYLIGRLLHAEWLSSKQLNLKRFYKRRLWRLTPPLLLMLVLYGWLAHRVWPDHYFVWRDIAAVVLYLGDIAMVTGAGPIHLLHSWSLGIEERFYLILPLLLLVWLRYGSVQRFVWLALGLAVWVSLWRWYWIEPEPLFDATQYYRFDFRVSGLLLGVALAFAPARVFTTLGQGGAWSGLLLLLGLWLLVVNPLGQAWRLAYGVPVAEVFTLLAIAHVLQQPQAPLARLLARPLWVYIGQISYGLYLFHYPLMQWLKLHYSWPLVALLGMAGALLLAALSWHLMERPLQRWRRERLA